jgi:leader peptidase (prepilin peptidase) / N-methyltransferase
MSALRRGRGDAEATMSARRLTSLSAPRGTGLSVESVTVAVAAVSMAAASMLVVPGWRGVAGAGLACLMIGIAAVDARRFIIPDEFSAAAFVLGLVAAALELPDAPGAAVATAALRGIVTALALFGLWAAYRRLRGREGIGLGDVKLAGVAGAWLDWPSIPLAFEIAALAALAACLARWLVSGRGIRATTRLPFGLFLAPAIWIAWLGETLLPQILSALDFGWSQW